MGCGSLCKKLNGLSAEPEVTQMTLDDKHELLLLASDGMWSHENGDGYGFGRSKGRRLCRGVGRGA